MNFCPECGLALDAENNSAKIRCKSCLNIRAKPRTFKRPLIAKLCQKGDKFPPLISNRERRIALTQAQPHERQIFQKPSFSTCPSSKFLASMTQDSFQRPPANFALLNSMIENNKKLTNQFMKLTVEALPRIKGAHDLSHLGDANTHKSYFKKDVANIRQTMKTLYSQLRLLDSLFDTNAESSNGREFHSQLSQQSTYTQDTKEDWTTISSSRQDDNSASFPNCTPSTSLSLISAGNAFGRLPDIKGSSHSSTLQDSWCRTNNKSKDQNLHLPAEQVKGNVQKVQTSSVIKGEHTNQSSTIQSRNVCHLNEEIEKVRPGESANFSKSLQSTPPFPIISHLKAGNYALELHEIKGVHFKVPLEELTISVMKYSMAYVNGEYILKPLHTQVFSNTVPLLSFQGNDALLSFSIPPIPFSLAKDRQLVVFVLAIRHMDGLVCWGIISAIDMKAWSEPLCGEPFDIEKVMKNEGSTFIYGASMSGAFQLRGNTSNSLKDKIMFKSSRDRLKAGCDNGKTGKNEAICKRLIKGMFTQNEKLIRIRPQSSLLKDELSFRSSIETGSDEIESGKTASDQSLNNSNVEKLQMNLSQELDRSSEGTLTDSISDASGPPTRPASALTNPSSLAAESSGLNSGIKEGSCSSAEINLGNSAKIVDSMLFTGSDEGDSSLSLDCSRNSISISQSENSSMKTKKNSKSYFFRPHTELSLVVDDKGRLVVPKDYKSNKGAVSRVDLSTFDLSLTHSENISELLNLENSDTKHEVHRKKSLHKVIGEKISLFIDCVFGIPLNSRCARVLIYLMNVIDCKTGALINPLHDPHSFMRRPDLVSYQTLTSSILNPEFMSELSVSVGGESCAVVIVEFITTESQFPIVLGHCCLSINKTFYIGNFLSRIRMGDPRRSSVRDIDNIKTINEIEEEAAQLMKYYTQTQIEASMDAQKLHNLLTEPPQLRAECVPMGFLAWRLNSYDKTQSYDLVPGHLSCSQAELSILASRQSVSLVRPIDRCILNKDIVEQNFVGRAKLLDDQLSFINMFDPSRGIFIRVECLRGLGKRKPFAYVVSADLFTKPNVSLSTSATETGNAAWRHLFFTTPGDPFSDVGIVDYADPPFILSDIEYNPYNMIFFTVFKVTLSVKRSSVQNSNSQDGQEGLLSFANQGVKIKEIGWCANKLFLETPGILRQGRFVLPLIKMSRLENIRECIKKESFNDAYIRLINEQSTCFGEPNATLTVAQGDPACTVQILSELPGQPHVHPLLIPYGFEKNFPISTNQGKIGYSFHEAYKSFLRVDEKRIKKNVYEAVGKYLRLNSLNDRISTCPARTNVSGAKGAICLSEAAV